MKVTLEIPDSAVCLTYQCFYNNPATRLMTVRQDVLDSRDLAEFREEEDKDENP